MPGAPVGSLAVLDAAELRRACLELGADDVGFVSLDREEVAPERAEILRLLSANPRGYWVRCSYRGTTAELSRKP